MNRIFNSDLKCLLHFDHPFYYEHNALLRDDTGNLKFKRVQPKNYNNGIASSYSPRDYNFTPKFGINSLYTEPLRWIKADNVNNLLNLDPEGDYSFGMFVNIASQSTPYLYEYNGHTLGIVSVSGYSSNASDFLNVFNDLISYDCTPVSIHSQDKLDFIINIAKSINMYLTLGLSLDVNNYSLSWVDGSNYDFDVLAPGTDLTAQGSNIWGEVSKNSDYPYLVNRFFNNSRLMEWNYILRPYSFIALGSELFLRYENSKLKLEVPSWNINMAGINNLSVNAWKYLSMKIHDGYIKIYFDGVEEISAPIPVNAEELTPDFISLGGFSGYIDEFSYRQSAADGVPTIPSGQITAELNCNSLGNFGNGSDGDLNISSENVLNSNTIITGINNNILSVNSWSSGLFQPEAGREVFLHVIKRKDADFYTTNASNYEQVNLNEKAGLFEFAKISSVDLQNNLIELSNFENNLNINAELLNNYFVQIITVPNFKNVHIESTGIIKANSFSEITGGGVVIFRSNGDIINEGKILTFGTGSPRIDLIEMSHADLQERFLNGTGGGTFITCAGAFTSPSGSRIGAEYSGAGENSNGGAGFGGGNSLVGIGSCDPAGIYARAGFDGNEWNGSRGGYGGANIFILCARLALDKNALSTGGEYGINTGSGISGCGGAGFCYIADKITG